METAAYFGLAHMHGYKNNAAGNSVLQEQVDNTSFF